MTSEGSECSMLYRTAREVVYIIPRAKRATYGEKQSYEIEEVPSHVSLSSPRQLASLVIPFARRVIILLSMIS